METLTDSYAHVGEPRFGAPESVWPVLRQAGVERAVFVLGPGVPALTALTALHETLGEAVRAVGIPWGEDPVQRAEFIAHELALGVIGLRLMPAELRRDAALLDPVGEAGRWLFAIDCHRSKDTAELLLSWLERHPEGRVAAPHFLEARPLLEACADAGLARALLAHPRFHAILSRHGGAAGNSPRPHENLRPWLDDVLPILGPRRIAWGSESPVLFWRNETIAGARDWLESLVGPFSPVQRGDYLRENAGRWFFASPAPAREHGAAPSWFKVPAQAAPVPLFGNGGWTVPGEAYATWLDAYLRAVPVRPELTFGAFLADAIGRGLPR